MLKIRNELAQFRRQPSRGTSSGIGPAAHRNDGRAFPGQDSVLSSDGGID
jgi:hypothetical protein